MSTPYKQAVEMWGRESQLDMVIEECSELILSIQRLRRGRGSAEDVKEEAADVQIMLRQLRAMGFDYDEIEKEKIGRLERRLFEAATKEAQT